MSDVDARGQIAAEVFRQYITTHLSGAAAATQTVERLAERLASEDLSAIHSELLEEQQVLTELLDTLELSQGTIRRTIAAAGERLAEAPRRLLEVAEPDLRNLMELEALIIGIEGKQALWRALLAIRNSSVAIDSLPLEFLEEQAERQQHTVEALRIDAAKRTLQQT